MAIFSFGRGKFGRDGDSVIRVKIVAWLISVCTPIRNDNKCCRNNPCVKFTIYIVNSVRL